MTNEIIEPHQSVILRFAHNTTSTRNDGKCVVLIAPYNNRTDYTFLNKTTHIQTWVIRLPNGEEAKAQMILGSIE